MKITERLPAIAVMAVLLGGVAIMVWQAVAPKEGTATVAVKVPPLSEQARRGNTAFDANCSACHGKNGAGTDKGPPLVHDIYNPGHHADPAFVIAARRGVRQHHWPFGDMPAQSQVADTDLAALIQYVRELQRANGIFYRPHNM